MPNTPKPHAPSESDLRYVTHAPPSRWPEQAKWQATVQALTDSESTLPDPEREAEQYRLYRLCPCSACDGTGYGLQVGVIVGMKKRRCKTCRGEGRTLELVATCGTKEAVGVALVTLTEEGEWDECPFGLMHRPEGQTGRWLLKPWGPSPRQISDAGRMLARSKNTTRPQ